MTDLDPAVIMAEHFTAGDWAQDGDRYCADCGEVWPCLPYRLAAALADAERRGAEKALREAASDMTPRTSAGHRSWLESRADRIAEGQS